MSARILHLGADHCHRRGVLESADFRVDECHNVSELRAAMESEPPPDAVIVTRDHGRLLRQAIALTMTHSRLPLILFGELQRSFAASEFDLVVPDLTSPEVWLPELAAVVAHGQTERLRSRLISSESKAPRGQGIENGKVKQAD